MPKLLNPVMVTRFTWQYKHAIVSPPGGKVGPQKPLSAKSCGVTRATGAVGVPTVSMGAVLCDEHSCVPPTPPLNPPDPVPDSSSPEHRMDRLTMRYRPAGMYTGGGPPFPVARAQLALIAACRAGV